MDAGADVAHADTADTEPAIALKARVGRTHLRKHQRRRAGQTRLRVSGHRDVAVGEYRKRRNGRAEPIDASQVGARLRIDTDEIAAAR